MKEIQWLKQRHEFWWYFLLERVPVQDEFDRTVPELKVTLKASRFAGQANIDWCKYNLNYLLQEQGKYDETVCHEVCHTFAKRIMIGSKHDSLWFYLYNVVCKTHRGRYHNYRVIRTKSDRPKEVQLVEEFIKLNKRIAAQINK